jgi:hypothetical protein
MKYTVHVAWTFRLVLYLYSFYGTGRFFHRIAELNSLRLTRDVLTGPVVVHLAAIVIRIVHR